MRCPWATPSDTATGDLSPRSENSLTRLSGFSIARVIKAAVTMFPNVQAEAPAAPPVRP